MNADIERLGRIIDRLETERAACRDEVSRLTGALSDARAEIDGLRGINGELVDGLSKMRRNVTMNRDGNEFIDALIRKAGGDRDWLEVEHRELRSELARLRAALKAVGDAYWQSAVCADCRRTVDGVLLCEEHSYRLARAAAAMVKEDEHAQGVE